MKHISFWSVMMMILYWMKKGIIKKDTEGLIDVSKEVGLEINAEKTMYVLRSRHQNAGQDHSLLIANKSFHHVTK
jgi:hypothetical protein